MNALIPVLLLAGFIEPRPPTRAIDPGAPPALIGTGTVAVVADGSRSWSGAECDAAVDQLRRDIASHTPVYVLRFDADSQQQARFVVAGSNRDVVQVRPLTPMMEAIAMTLDNNAVRPLAAMVVIAHAQMSPSYLQADHVISFVRSARVPVHTIHLSGRKEPAGLFRRLGRVLLSGTMWAVDTLIEEDDPDGYSAADTARMLRSMSEETGGVSCIAAHGDAALSCIQKISALITETADRPRAGNGPTP